MSVVALRYTFTISNDGHAVLHNITLSDPSLVSGTVAPAPVPVVDGEETARWNR